MNSLLKSTTSKCKLDCLPYDVIISILQSPLLDTHHIMLLAEVWPHYNSLVMHVLQYYQLPRLYLQSTMDQEGKRRYHSWFHFHHLDVTNGHVTFMVEQRPGISKRYISNSFTAARPHLRHITLHHHLSSPSVIPTITTSSADLSLVGAGEKIPSCSAFSSSCSSLANLCPENTNKSPSNLLLLHDFNTMTTGTNMIQSRPLSLKHGFHTLSIRSCRQNQQKQRQPNSKEIWQFSYRVSYTNDLTATQKDMNDKSPLSTTKRKQQKLKTEHMYLSPIYVTVSLSTLRSSSSYNNNNNTKKPSASPTSTWFKKYIKPKLTFL